MKKTIALALAIVLAAIFFSGFITGNNTSSVGGSSLEAEPVDATVAPTVESLIGSAVSFGGYYWRVLDVQDDRALIITETITERRPYNVERTAVTWETSTLRAYLNGEFLQKFTREDQDRIAETRVQNPDNPWFDTPGGNDTTDKIFLLSLDEVVKYFGDSGRLRNRPSEAEWVSDQYNSARRAVDVNGWASWWWLRSPGDDSDSAAGVGVDGVVHVCGGDAGVTGAGGAVRPALWLNL